MFQKSVVELSQILMMDQLTKNLVGKLNEDIKVDYGLNTESVDENEVADDSPTR